MPLPVLIPLAVKYGIPLASYGVVHLVHLFTHKKYTGPSMEDIARN